jgi:hypothetical protein
VIERVAQDRRSLPGVGKHFGVAAVLGRCVGYHNRIRSERVRLAMGMYLQARRIKLDGFIELRAKRLAEVLDGVMDQLPDGQPTKGRPCLSHTR